MQTRLVRCRRTGGRIQAHALRAQLCGFEQQDPSSAIVTSLSEESPWQRTLFRVDRVASVSLGHSSLVSVQ